MGHYLSEPITEKEVEKGESDEASDLKLVYSCVSMQGWRRTMEDTYYVNSALPQGEALFCVFDGHGGREVSLFCRMEFERTLLSQDAYHSKNYE